METNGQPQAPETTETDALEQVDICDYCNVGYQNLDVFSCKHKICTVCLFRRIFILNITELNGSSNSIKIKCSKCTEGTLSKNLDELSDLCTHKANIFKEKKENPGSNDNSNKCKEHHLSRDFLCLDCCEQICRKCTVNIANPHYNHNIKSNDKVANILKAEIKIIPLKFTNKELFDHNWNVICKKIKDSSQETFNETITKIEELTRILNEFRKEYEQNYKNELTKIVKTLKVLKAFYSDYYDEKEDSEQGKDINSLRYINSINNELLNIDMVKDVTYIQKVNEAKLIIDNLKSNNNVNFTTKLIFAKLKNNFNFENETKNAHDKFISSIIELKDDKLLSTSFDYSMKIWEAKGSEFTNIKTISKRCGCIISSLKIDNEKILTSNNSTNTIYMWAPHSAEGYQIEQSLTLHNKIVVCMTQLKNGNLITSGMDNLIIIWRKKEGTYEEKETIQEEFPVKKIIALKDNKFGYTGDDGVLKIMAEKEPNKETNNNGENNDEENKTEENKTEENKTEENKNEIKTSNGYEKVCELKRHSGKINCMCELKNGYLFTGGAKANNKNDHYIIVWKPDEENGYNHHQTLSGHKSDISDIIQLKDGRIASSSKDRTLIIWKAIIENESIKYVQDEILTEYPHGMYGLLELSDNRICTVTSNNSIISWRKWGSLVYC